MRIICPNCDAQYEVDDAAIPPEGRDVQCSNCGNAWFQAAPASAEKLTAALYDDPAPAEDRPAALAQGEEEREDTAPAPQPIKRNLDEAVLSVLREEAEREAKARKAVAEGLEMQGDLGLPPPVNPAVNRQPPGPAEDAPEPSPAERRVASLKGKPVPPPKATARRDLLPDIEEINSSLKPSPMGQTAVMDDEPAASSGFRSGFVLMLLVGLVATVAYVMAPQISQQIPGLTGAMEGYVAAIDAGRVVIDGAIRSATSFLQGLTGS